MSKNTLFQNQKSFIPQITVTKEQTNKQFVLLLTEAELDQTKVQAQKPYISAIFSNQALINDVKKAPQIVYGRDGEAFEKVLVISTKDSEVKGAYKTGRANLKKIVEYFRGVDDITIDFSNSLTQEFLNEYIYGVLVENYQWQFKSEKPNTENKTIFKSVKSINFVSTVLNTEDAVYQYVTKVAQFNLFSKELINTRANIANTYWMRDQAKAIQQANPDKVSIELLEGKQLLEKGLNLMHAVGRASSSEPILAILNYKGNPEEPTNVYSVVGKGVVYDNGGLNIKMTLTDLMHCDKGGACSCLGTFKGVVELGLKINLVCTVALVENAIDGNAYRPSDIITTLKGINVEITNTDAEGRNILADALTYTQLNYKPHTVFDFATLTGACLVALGMDTSAIFSNDEELCQQMVKHSIGSHEPCHPLPITQWMHENIASDQGDIRNAGKTAWGGSGCAAAFLSNFIEEGVKWCHFDIVQASCTKGEQMQVRTILDYYKTQSKQ